MGEQIVKRVAADGTQRGLKRRGSKNRATELLEQMQEDAHRLFGIDNHDPVRAMNLVGMMAWQGYPATDNEGRPVLDENGDQVMIPPDHQLALAAFAKVAPYVRSQLRPKDEEADNNDDDPSEDREELLGVLESMGVKVEGYEEGDDE
ncbi:hypothetical protein FDH38_gp015 [Dinoroseobacter phage vB_DshS-R5C]|uniref:Uncharacterized protein n=1 Tax=Dinoroseobacter phage vB_DshS-R5C TaxID=1965368 RepID=A0A1V0DY47_9CAUD|nr:hypothetical protein FDH38_gp015 [Dinoroseobacter phage vB_DshS-R5C]ARB06069.1 hypothetical protein vBDshSR5C_15 [Dinoroseobacter phage vB_DshS-R5C]